MPDAIAILAILATVSVKVFALVMMAAVAARVLRSASAACRHVLWTAVLASALAIAVMAPAPAMWSLPVGALVRVPGLGAPGFPATNPVAGDEAPPTTGAPGEGASPAHARAWVGHALLLIWVAGVAILALRIVAGQMILRRIAARGRPIEAGTARAALLVLAGRSRLRRVRMIETDAFMVPATWGLLRPVIALPAAAGAWPAPRLEAALRHELAHIRRGDALTQAVAELCCALLWFHPAVWFASRRMRWERERACDNAVLSTGGPDIDYAEWLFDLAQSVSRGGAGSIPSALAMAEGHGLEDRLRAILDPTTPRSSPRTLMASVPAGVLIAAVAMAGLGVSGEAAPITAAQESAEILYGERVPLSTEQERWALSRHFHPRDEREAQAFERLLEGTRHEKQHSMDLIRERAVWALSVAREDEVMRPLVEALDNADWRVRSYAAWCLGVVGAADAREELTTMVRDPVWRVRAMAAATLAGLADPRSAEDMLPLTADPAWQVRWAAVDYLARVRTPEALAAVRTRLNDPHVAVRSAARATLDEPPTP